jgi:hypothetical protein
LTNPQDGLAIRGAMLFYSRLMPVLSEKEQGEIKDALP